MTFGRNEFLVASIGPGYREIYLRRISVSGKILDVSPIKIPFNLTFNGTSAFYNDSDFIVSVFLTKINALTCKTNKISADGIAVCIDSFTIDPGFTLNGSPVISDNINGISLVTYSGWVDKYNSKLYNSWRMKGAFYQTVVSEKKNNNKSISRGYGCSIYQNRISRAIIIRPGEGWLAGSLINIDIYNSQGRIIRTIREKNSKSEIVLNSKNGFGEKILSGIYYIRIFSKEKSLVKKTVFFQ